MFEISFKCGDRGSRLRDASPQYQRGRPFVVPPRLKQLVLIAEDDALVSMAVEEINADAGFDFLVADNAQEAIVTLEGSDRICALLLIQTGSVFDHGCTGTDEITLFKARRIAWPFLFCPRDRAPRVRLAMTETHSKSLQQAEIAFGHSHLQFLALGCALKKIVPVVQARQEGTRLREARLANEAQEIATTSSGVNAKRTRKA